MGSVPAQPGRRPVKVAVTRPRHRAGALCAALRSHGLIPVVRSLVRIEVCVTPRVLVEPMGVAPADDLPPWLLLTSVEAVHALDKARRALNVPWPVTNVACVGPATADAARRAGLEISLMPSQWDSAGLAASLTAAGVAGARFYWPRAEAADQELKTVLVAAGAKVNDVAAYRTVPDERGGARLERDLRAGSIDVVLLLSPSAADAYAALARPVPERVLLGVMGRSTGARVRAHGLTVHMEPAVHSITALAAAVSRYVDVLESGPEK